MYRPLHDDDGDGDALDVSGTDLDEDRITHHHHGIEMLDMSNMVDIDTDTVDDDDDKSLTHRTSIDQDTSIQQSRSADDLFGLDENSSVLAKLIILNRQSSPVILSYFLSLGGNFINLLFAGRFINSDDRNQVFAGMEMMDCMIAWLDCNIAICKHEPNPPS